MELMQLVHFGNHIWWY